MATVIGVDLATGRVVTDRGAPLDYDTLVVAAGTISHEFGTPGVAAHAFALKTAADSLALRTHLLARFEDAALTGTAAPGGLDVVVCGGGPTGVEMAGGLAELYQRVLAKDFPQLDVRGARIALVEAADRLLGTFHESLGERARRTLERRGVEVLTGSPVASVEPGIVHLVDGRSIAAGTVVWAAGVRANPLATLLGVELGRGGRIVVGSDLAVPSHPEVFAIGDIAIDPDAPLPQVAQPAIQGGYHVARQIVRRLQGQPREPFHYRDKGSMATIGRHDAVAEFPNGWRLSGPVGWLAWLGLHLVYLMGFRNRANVLVNWAWNYLTYDHASRLISPPDR
jgi:NADH dehydrogenase